MSEDVAPTPSYNLQKAKQCKATSKTTRERCRNPAVSGSDCCRMHGGTQPKGVASPNFKNGRYSKHLKKEFNKIYGDFIEDKELLNLRQDIALIDTLTCSLLDEAQKGGSPDLWKELKSQADNFLKAQQIDNIAGMTNIVTDIIRLIKEGEDRINTYEAIDEKIKIRRQLVDTASKREFQESQVMSVTEARKLIAVFCLIAREAITENAPPDIARKILGQFSIELSRRINVSSFADSEA